MATKQPDKKPQADLNEVVSPIKEANNILVTINNSPTVDQLAACIGMTLVLNKLGKHATAVFSGDVPSTLEFLKPEDTLEKNTDSLRDFIISLDKSKADKLRYKVEDDVVKIFITPYKTSIDEKDLEFSQGDFNVDVVIALGIDEKKNLDDAILAHGRILHDATVISINIEGNSHIGSINWSGQDASSLCEMVTDIVQSLSKDVLDQQNATALLTGIVAETDRYSNEKATPHTMSIAGTLMSAGASTQLVSNELDAVLKSQALPPLSMEGEGDLGNGNAADGAGVLDIDHTKKEEADSGANTEDSPDNLEKPPAEPQEEKPSSRPVDEYLDNLNLSQNPHPPAEPSSDEEYIDSPDQESPPADEKATGRLVTEPPHFTGQLTANTIPEDRQYTGSTDPLTNMPESTPIVDTDKEQEEIKRKAAKRASSLQQKVDQTLREIEEAVSSPHLAQEEEQFSDNSAPPTDNHPSVDEARRAAEAAALDDNRPEPRRDIGTTPLGNDIDHGGNSSESSNPPPPAPPPITPLT